MKDIDCLIMAALKTDLAKEKYVLYRLRKDWALIVGEAAARHSQPYRLQHATLFIHTDNPSWSHNFLTMQGKLLAAIGKALPRKNGRRLVSVKVLKMFHGVLEEAPEAKENERPFMPHLDAARRCPCCGVPLIEGETICSACRRKRAEATRQKIHQVLKKTPWISYEDCRHAVECDKMTFTDVKSLLGEWAMGKALDPQAKSVDKAFAVMLTRSLSPEQMSDERIDAIIEKERSRRTYVPASGKQLRYKK